MTEIFISYAREDVARITVLAKCLENQGFTVFWDRRIRTGAHWREAIVRALEGADHVLVAWSKASVGSNFVREEAQFGQSKNRLIPILLESVQPPFGFGQIQTADLIRWTGDEHAVEFQQLVRDLGNDSHRVSEMPVLVRRPQTGAKRAALGLGLGGLLMAGVGAAVVQRAYAPDRPIQPNQELSLATSTPPPTETSSRSAAGDGGALIATSASPVASVVIPPPKPSSKRPPPVPPAPKPNCDPNFVLDATGNKLFKRECFATPKGKP